MLKTNTKKARANVMAYIRKSSADYYVEGYDAPEDITDGDLCRLILEDFFDTWGHEVARHNKPIQQAFIEWGAGLTAGDLFDYFYNADPVEIVGDILEETAEERSKYTEEQAADLLGYLIFREVSARAEKA